MDQKPRQELGKLLRKTLHCPLCPRRVELDTGGFGSVTAGAEDRAPLHVVAFRIKSVRMECPECGLRFSIDPVNLADVVGRKAAMPKDQIEFEAQMMAREDPSRYLEALTRVKALNDRQVREARNRVLEPHRKGVETTNSRSSGRVRFPKKPTKEAKS